MLRHTLDDIDKWSPPRWSLPARILAGFTGIGLLCWPITSYVVLFAGDASSRKVGQGMATFILTILTWGYGPRYRLAWLGYRKLLTRKVQEPLRLIVWLLPLSVPFYYLWFFGTF